MSNERELYIKKLIKEQGLTVKDFATKIGIPYSTILSMLNGSIGGTAIDTVVKICQNLNITINELQQCGTTEIVDIILTDFEKTLISQYRKQSEFHNSIHKLLDIGL